MVPAVPILVSTRTKFLFTFLALGFFLGGLVVIVGGHGSGVTREVTWALLGAGVALFFVALTARQPKEACSFCHRPPGVVRYLTASTAASVCDRDRKSVV